MDPPGCPPLQAPTQARSSVPYNEASLETEAAPTCEYCILYGHEEFDKSEESCPVCGDRVSGYHYGLLTCESCKGFFKRSVQNNKHYTCTEQQSCPMNRTQRKRCPYCRFQKCLAVGMKTEAVRADRMRGGRNRFGPLYRRDRQIKLQRLSLNAAMSSSAFQQCHMYNTGMPHSGVSTPNWDCDMDVDRGLTSLPLPYSEQLPLTGHPQEKCHMSFDYHTASTSHAMHRTVSETYTTRSTQASSSNANIVDCDPDHASPLGPFSSFLTPNFLDALIESEQDESQLCAKVLSSLQREQANRGKHDCLNTFSIMCKMADQTLFGLVEWARNSALFKELKVEDQMVLLQNCWSELLVLDHLYRQVTYGKEGCVYLVTGQQVSTIISQAGVTLSGLVSRTQDLVAKLKALYFDRKEFVCLKYLVLFNPDVKAVLNRRQVEQTQERVNRALMEHTRQTHAGHADKFGQLLLRLPEVRSISLQVEEYLYQQMLHTKHN
uniref:Nuclear receptor subfamily 5, group A, member 5 n=1 Tax=Neogobius melanostomus TaxID=47308 RepID=A0A8C6SVQ3_9GOBI